MLRAIVFMESHFSKSDFQSNFHFSKSDFYYVPSLYFQNQYK